MGTTTWKFHVDVIVVPWVVAISYVIFGAHVKCLLIYTYAYDNILQCPRKLATGTIFICSMTLIHQHGITCIIHAPLEAMSYSGCWTT